LFVRGGFARAFLRGRARARCERMKNIPLTALEMSMTIDSRSASARRTAVLINCSKKEADKIRDHSKLERRTVSGYVLNIVMRAVAFDEGLFAKLSMLPELAPGFASRPPGRRTTMLLHCSIVEAGRLRAAAKRRDITISGFVLRTLRRSWNVQEKLSKA